MRPRSGQRWVAATSPPGQRPVPSAAMGRKPRSVSPSGPAMRVAGQLVQLPAQAVLQQVAQQHERQVGVHRPAVRRVTAGVRRMAYSTAVRTASVPAPLPPGPSTCLVELHVGRPAGAMGQCPPDSDGQLARRRWGRCGRDSSRSRRPSSSACMASTLVPAPWSATTGPTACRGDRLGAGVQLSLAPGKDLPIHASLPDQHHQPGGNTAGDGRLTERTEFVDASGHRARLTGSDP